MIDIDEFQFNEYHPKVWIHESDYERDKIKSARSEYLNNLANNVRHIRWDDQQEEIILRLIDIIDDLINR